MFHYKNKYKVLETIIIVLICFSVKAKAINIDAQTNNINKVWNIKFNQYIDFNENTKKEIEVKDIRGNVVKTDLVLKDGKTLSVMPPKEGYKNNGIYTLNIGSKIYSQTLRGLNQTKFFTFKVDNDSEPYNNTSYEYKQLITKIINCASDKILDNKISNDWQAYLLYKNKRNVPNYYAKNIEESLKQELISQPTDYERTVLGLIASNKDPLNFCNFNFIKTIYDSKDIEYQGINAYIFGLIALDADNYKIPENAVWTRDKLINTILQFRTKDKGWDFAGISIDPDMTGMAISALAPYRNREDVRKAIDEAIDKLSSIQNIDGTFSCYGLKNAESVAQVIIGLCANGIDPTSSRFTKGNVNLIDALLTFKVSEGGFCHTYDGMEDSKATEQATLALEAYKSFKEGKGSIYR